MLDIQAITPNTCGWIQVKLSKNEIDFLWECVKNKKESAKYTLAGNIKESNLLTDKDNWFLNNTILPLCNVYANTFQNLGKIIPTNQMHPYFIESFWVNYQRENEFNPLHNHGGVYSFVVWMKIPTKHLEQNENKIAKESTSPSISTFKFVYSNMLGQIENYVYEMNPEMEGTMLFFPSQLQHLVYPFYNCDKERISISGNVYLDTTTIL